MSTVQWKSEANYADSNGVVSSYGWLTGTGTEDATVLDIGAYCIATPGATAVNTDWSTTMPETGTPPATLWPGEVGALLLPEAGTYMVTDGSGDLQKYFYFRAWPGVLTEMRWWRVVQLWLHGSLSTRPTSMPRRRPACRST